MAHNLSQTIGFHVNGSFVRLLAKINFWFCFCHIVQPKQIVAIFKSVDISLQNNVYLLGKDDCPLAVVGFALYIIIYTRARVTNPLAEWAF